MSGELKPLADKEQDGIRRQEKISFFHAEITKALAMVECLRCQGDITQDTANEFVRLLENAEQVFAELTGEK